MSSKREEDEERPDACERCGDDEYLPELFHGWGGEMWLCDECYQTAVMEE